MTPRPVRVKQHTRRFTQVPSLKTLPGETDMPPVGPGKLVVATAPVESEKLVVAAEGEVQKAEKDVKTLRQRLVDAKKKRKEAKATGRVTRAEEAKVQVLEAQAGQAQKVLQREKAQAALIRQQAATQKGTAAQATAQAALLKEELKRQKLATREAALISKERQRAQKERLRLQKARLAKSRAKGRKPLFG